jgi:hypothetical protein
VFYGLPALTKVSIAFTAYLLAIGLIGINGPGDQGLPRQPLVYALVHTNGADWIGGIEFGY